MFSQSEIGENFVFLPEDESDLTEGLLGKHLLENLQQSVHLLEAQKVLDFLRYSKVIVSLLVHKIVCVSHKYSHM